MKASGALKEAARCLNIDHTIADAYSKKIKDVSFDDDEDYHDNDLEYAKLDHVNDGSYCFKPRYYQVLLFRNAKRF